MSSPENWHEYSMGKAWGLRSTHRGYISITTGLQNTQISKTKTPKEYQPKPSLTTTS